MLEFVRDVLVAVRKMLSSGRADEALSYMSQRWEIYEDDTVEKLVDEAVQDIEVVLARLRVG